MQCATTLHQCARFTMHCIIIINGRYVYVIPYLVVAGTGTVIGTGSLSQPPDLKRQNVLIKCHCCEWMCGRGQLLVQTNIHSPSFHILQKQNRPLANQHQQPMSRTTLKLPCVQRANVAKHKRQQRIGLEAFRMRGDSGSWVQSFA